MSINSIEITEAGVKILVPANAFTAAVVSGVVTVKTAFSAYSVSESLSALKAAANATETNVIEVTDFGDAVLVPARNFTAKDNGTSREVKTAWTTLSGVSQTLAQLKAAANA